MDFPEINAFPKCFPGPYQREMGTTIANLLRVFAEVAPDEESNRRVLELAETPRLWSAGHAACGRRDAHSRERPIPIRQPRNSTK